MLTHRKKQIHLFTGQLPLLISSAIFLMLVLGYIGVTPRAHAQSSGKIQELTGQIDPGGVIVYQLVDLSRGQTIYVYITGTSGDLDPTVVLLDDTVDPVVTRENYRTAVSEAIAAGQDPTIAVPEIADQMFLAWDDDSGSGYDGALAYTVEADGTYLLAIGSTPQRETLGQYQLLIGVDAPEVLTGEADPTGDIIATFEGDLSRFETAVQEITGTLSVENPSTFYTLKDLKPGDTLYAFVEATSGNLRPVIILEDFGEKPIRTGNFLGEDNEGQVEFTFDQEARNYRLNLSSCCEGEQLGVGDYRLLVGINAPEVLSGVATPTDNTVVEEPIAVQIGLKMQQITSVDQISENFGVVASMQMRWQDPKLAFNPDSCNCRFKTFNGNAFVNFANQNEITWPEFTLFNQQGRRDTQNQVVVVLASGEAIYVERFSATLQAPDFDFRPFPFDTQQFFIRIDSLFPEEFFVFSELEGFSELGEQLGEEEWIITDFDTAITTEIASTQSLTSRFSFGFEAERHISFYVIRVFIPILIILIVSWFTFFLKDYSKRVDVSAGNLLLFIAFNFTISGDLPRLGYLTFLDTVLITTFIVTGLVVAFNVLLRRLELSGRVELAQRIDRYTIWAYPLAYLIGLGLVTWLSD